MREALIRRIEADYRRTAAITRPEGKSKRQFREARRRRKARLWIVERALNAAQLLAATTESKTNEQALEHWSEQVDAMADLWWQVRQRQTLGTVLLGWLRPATLVEPVQAERAELAPSFPVKEGRTNVLLPS